ncbi:MAG: hypothetical protein EBX40_06055 [Gammaproteobacteria bacterium]|nr:hypothetical protein [Gammaproteobacteria bacterium]
MDIKIQEAKATKDKQQGKRNDLEHLSNGKKLQGGGNGVEYTLRRLARDNPEWSQQDIANEVRTSRQYVHEVLSSKTFDSKELVDTIPDHINGNSDKADYSKLPGRCVSINLCPLGKHTLSCRSARLTRLFFHT